MTVLSIRINRTEYVMGEVAPDNIANVGMVIADVMPELERMGRVSILLTQGNVTRIIRSR